MVERLQAGTIRSDPSSTRIHVGRDLPTNDHHICNLCKNRARTPIRALSQWNTLKSIHFLYIPVYFTKNSIVHLLQDMLICQIFGTYIKGIWDWEPPFYGSAHHQSPIPAVCQAVRPPLDVFRRAVSGHLGRRKPGDLWDLWDHQKEWEKNGKTGILGQYPSYCSLLWFLCYCSRFLPYLWCFMWYGFWEDFAPNFHCWCLDWMGVGFV